jgi:hypothetical protein
MIYRFNGIIRWSKVNMQEINIHNIQSIKQRERLFCIFDKNKKYCLDVLHKNDYSTDKFPYYQEAGLTTFRYFTKQDRDNDFKIVNKLKIIMHNQTISDNLKATK